MTKNKILRITIAALLIILSIAGTSMAYFTDIEEETNVFTAGNVDIALSFKDKTINVDENTADVEFTDLGVYPGQKIDINATIENTGSEAAYVGAIITIAIPTNAKLPKAKLTDIITQDGNDKDNIPVSFANFLTGLTTTTTDSTEYTVKYTTAADGKSHVIYIIKNTALAGKKKDTNDMDIIDSYSIFESVVIPTEWDNAQMKIFNGLTLNVKAYATQKAGFTDAVTAIRTAFGYPWDVFNPINP